MPHHTKHLDTLADALPVYPFRLRFQASAPGRRFLGSAWRGAVGHQLKRAVCMFARGVCQSCPLRGSCLYAHCFDDEATKLPPFTLYPSWQDQGETLWIDMVLLGDTHRDLPYFVHAFKEAGARGVAGKQFTFTGIEHWQDHAWQPLNGQPKPLPWQADMAEAVCVQMQSPMRAKAKGRYLGVQEISLSMWLTVLRRRLIHLADAYGQKDVMIQLCDNDQQDDWQQAQWRWREFERYSSRQQTAMKIGGLVGEFQLSARQVSALWPMLWLGQWVHTGKLATMGLGRYQMEVVEG